MTKVELPPIDPPSPEVLSQITKEKAEFIEEQVNQMYDFSLESSEILRKEAHTTLQWLFALTIGSSGYLITLIAKQYDPKLVGISAIWWLLIPLITVATGAAIGASLLIRNALLTNPVYPKGNFAQHLTIPGLVARSDFQMRFLEAWGLQRRILLVQGGNRDIGKAINLARQMVVLVPGLGLGLLLVYGLLAWVNSPLWLNALVTVLAPLLWYFLLSWTARRAAPIHQSLPSALPS